MSRPISSWLHGRDPEEIPSDAYPGASLGLPETGSGALAGSFRRFGALLLDWFIAYGLAGLLLTAGLYSVSWVSTAVLVIWFVIGAVSVRLFGFSPGQLALGLQVRPIDGRLHVGFGRAVMRGLLLALVIPALFMDADGRGLHDKFTNTAVVRR